MYLRNELRPQLVDARARKHPVGPPGKVPTHVGEHDLVGVHDLDPILEGDQPVDLVEQSHPRVGDVGELGLALVAARSRSDRPALHAVGEHPRAGQDYHV